MREEPEEIFETLEEARERMKELKRERQKLLKANKKVIKILVAMEEDLRDAGVEIEEMDDYTYSFHRGWKSHREELQIEDISEEDVDRQLEQLDKLIKDIDFYKG